MKSYALLPETIAIATAWEAAGKPPITASQAVTVAIDPTVQHFTRPFIAAAGATSTPIDWAALIAQLLPLILALIAAFGGGGTPTPAPAKHR